MPLSFNINGRSHAVGSDVVTIGRDQTCTVAIPDARLNSYHAEIREAHGRLIIEACQGGELYIDQGRSVHCAWLRAGDRIRLSKNGPEISVAAENRSPCFRLGGTWRQVKWPNKVMGRRSNQWGLACVLALAIGLLGLAITVHLHKPVLQADPTRAPIVTEYSVWEPDGVPLPVVVPPEPDEVASELAAESHQEPVTPRCEPPDVIGSLHLVLLESPDHSKSYRLGTAFAVGPRQLISSAAIVSALQSHQAAGAEIFVQNTVAGKTLRIVDMSIPPGYLDVCRQLDALQDQLQGIQVSQIDSTTEGAGDREQKLGLAEESLLNFSESQAFLDAAMIHVEAELPAYLEIEDASASSIDAATNLTLVGLPFPTSQFAVLDRQLPAMQQVAATITARSSSATTGQAHGLLLQCSRIAAGDNWCGSPVINDSGRVVGVYSRPAARTAQGNDSVSLHYLAGLSAVRALAQ